METPADFITEGVRVSLQANIDRYPHFIAPKGAVGTVVAADALIVAVRLDDPVAGAETWDNEVHWYDADDDDRWDARFAAARDLNILAAVSA